MARASSAAIVVEQLAAQSDPTTTDDSSATGQAASSQIETPAATYDNGKVYLKSNPLKTTSEIRCTRCGLPRLLYPTDGVGARTPDPGVEYCRKLPFIEKPYYDIYGQTYVPLGPGRGKKKKDMINPLANESTPNGSQGSSTNSPPTNEPPKPIAFPHAKCLNCTTFLPIKRMSNHMVKCIGGGGRDSSRNALLKMQNGNSNGTGNQNGNTSPSSRQSTPTSNPAASRSSPNKRSAGDDFDSDSPPQKKKKKTIKKTLTTKLKVLPKPLKSTIGSQHSASNLSFEEKAPQSEEEEDEDDGDGEYGTVVVEPKAKAKAAKKKVKEAESKKKWLHGKGGGKAVLPPLQTAKNGNGGREASESSQTLSSPN
jgi:hypothetical protein